MTIMKDCLTKVFFVIGVTFCLIFPTEIQAQANSVAAETALVQAGPHFFANDSVIIDENLQGDVYISAGEVIVNSVIDGDLLVVGGSVVINGEVSQDVRAAGGMITLVGQVGGNVSAAAGEIILDEESAIGNSALLAAGSIVSNGLIAGKTWMAAETIALNSQLGSNVQVWASDLSVLPATSIAGVLTAEVASEPVITEDAQFQEQPVITVRDFQAQQNTAAVGAAGRVVTEIIKFIMNLTFGALLIYFFPRLSQRLANSVVKGPLVSLGWGFLQLLLIPVAIIFLIITVVGIPVAVLLTLGYFALLLTGSLVTSLAIGQRIQIGFAQNKGLHDPYIQFTLGLLLLTVVSLIPVLGALASVLALIMGMGAMFIAFKASLRSPRSVNKKLSL